MSKKKRSKQNLPPQAPASVSSSNPVLPTAEAFTRQITFDSLEDKIRGEEMLQDHEQKIVKEGRAIQKELESAEVDRRMEELRRQLGLKEGPKPRKK